MSRVYLGKTDVTCAWAQINAHLTMSQLVNALNQWHEAHRADFVRRDYSNLLPTLDTQEEKHAHIGEKYIRLDVGGSGAWMLEITSGIIYGIKGYGVPDKKKIAGNVTDSAFDGAVLFHDRFRRGRFDNRRLPVFAMPAKPNEPGAVKNIGGHWVKEKVSA